MRIVLLAFTASVLISCIDHQDDVRPCNVGCTILKGRITTEGGTVGIAGIPVEAKWIYAPQYSHQIIRKKAVGKTNADGYYELTFSLLDDELEPGYGYHEIAFTADPNRYFFLDGEAIAVVDLVRDTTVVVSSYLLPKVAFIDVHLKNHDLIAPQNSFFTQFEFCTAYCSGMYGQSGGVYFWYPNSPSITRVKVAGNQPVIITNAKRIGETYTNRSDTLTIPAGKSVPYIVDYLQ